MRNCNLHTSNKSYQTSVMHVESPTEVQYELIYFVCVENEVFSSPIAGGLLNHVPVCRLFPSVRMRMVVSSTYFMIMLLSWVDVQSWILSVKSLGPGQQPCGVPQQSPSSPSPPLVDHPI